MLLIGVAGTELTAQERDWLQHDAVAGVVLFKRNFASRQQVTDLSAAIRAAAPRPQLICVDQEGGRVQRFREGYSIGNRAFSEDPHVVAAFTAAYVRGMHAVGMAATLKHFPGHGTVLEDTHVDTAIDPRALDELRAQDLVPFQAGIAAGADAVMMAHVIYPQIAPEPAGYSPRWIQDILRGELGFRGVVFSDDIGMAASHSAGGVPARVHAHLDAGCDVVLVCHPELVDEALHAVQGRSLNTAALLGLIGRGALGWDGLLADARHGDTQTRLLETLGRTV